MSLIQKTIAAGLAFAAGTVLVACGGGKSSSSSAAAGSSPAAGGSPAAAASPAASTGAMTGGAGMKSSAKMAGKTLTIKMVAQNGSKQDGTATITDKGTGIVVSVKLTNAPAASSEPAHIHKGTCATLDPVPWKPLKNVVGGTAQSTVPGVTIAMLQKAKYAINVHKSLNDLKTYVSCGDITQ